MGPAVLRHATLVPEKSQKLGLQLEPAVIRADGNLQILHSSGADASPALKPNDGKARTDRLGSLTRANLSGESTASSVSAIVQKWNCCRNKSGEAQRE